MIIVDWPSIGPSVECNGFFQYKLNVRTNLKLYSVALVLQHVKACPLPCSWLGNKQTHVHIEFSVVRIRIIILP